MYDRTSQDKCLICENMPLIPLICRYTVDPTYVNFSTWIGVPPCSRVAISGRLQRETTVRQNISRHYLPHYMPLIFPICRHSLSCFFSEEPTSLNISTSIYVPLCCRVAISVTKLLPPSGPWDPCPRSGYSKRLLLINCTSCFFVTFTHTNSLSRFCVRCHHPLFRDGRFIYIFKIWGVPMCSFPESLSI